MLEIKSQHLTWVGPYNCTELNAIPVFLIWTFGDPEYPTAECTIKKEYYKLLTEIT